MSSGTSSASSRWAELEIAAIAFLPGALAGTQIAGLLFFLNPHLPFTPEPVARAVALYATLLGLGTLILHLPFVWKRRERAREILPWTLTLTLGISAIFALFHASHYSFFLPAGINRRLVKLGILLILSAVVAFYTALLHQLRRRPYGRGSKTLLGLLAILSVYFALERREAFKPPPHPPPRATTVESSQRPRLLVVGIEAATLDVILPLAERGRLPFFARLRQEGAHGRMASMTPVTRTPLWITLATGKNPYRHGVVGDALYAAPFAGDGRALDLLPAAMGFGRWGTQILPRTRDVRAPRVLPLWEILARLEVSTAVVGWPLAAPARADLTVLLSEDFFLGTDEPEDRATPEIEERARLFKPRVEEIDPDLLATFGQQPPAPILDSLARDLWRESLSEFIIRQDSEIEAFFLLLPGLRSVSRQYFGAHAATHFKGIRESETEQAARLLAAYYGHLDSFLANLWQSVPSPRLLVVASTHGVAAPSGWRKLRRQLTRQPAHEGFFQTAPPGVLMILGDGVRPGALLNEVELVDLVPTLLYGLDFPVAEDLDGTVLTRAFDTAFLARHALTFVPSYETLAGR